MFEVSSEFIESKAEETDECEEVWALKDNPRLRLPLVHCLFLLFFKFRFSPLILYLSLLRPDRQITHLHIPTDRKKKAKSLPIYMDGKTYSKSKIIHLLELTRTRLSFTISKPVNVMTLTEIILKRISMSKSSITSTKPDFLSPKNC